MPIDSIVTQKSSNPNHIPTIPTIPGIPGIQGAVPRWQSWYRTSSRPCAQHRSSLWDPRQRCARRVPPWRGCLWPERMLGIYMGKTSICGYWIIFIDISIYIYLYLYIYIYIYIYLYIYIYVCVLIHNCIYHIHRWDLTRMECYGVNEHHDVPPGSRIHRWEPWYLSRKLHIPGCFCSMEISNWLICLSSMICI